MKQYIYTVLIDSLKENYEIQLKAITEAINGMEDIELRQANYYFPFGIYGDLHVSNDYLKSIDYNAEAFRKDLFDKIGFEYTPVNKLVTEDQVDVDALRRNGVKYTINSIEYGVDFSALNMIDFYIKNLDQAPRVKVKTR